MVDDFDYEQFAECPFCHNVTTRTYNCHDCGSCLMMCEGVACTGHEICSGCEGTLMYEDGGAR